MENEQVNDDEILNDIGYIAKKIDQELTMIERMKIKKSTLFRILIAMGIYSATMILFMFGL